MVVMQDSRWVLLFGYSGNTAMRPDWPLDRCADIVLARVYPQLSRVGAMRVGYDPQSWLTLRDGDRFVLYRYEASR